EPPQLLEKMKHLLKCILLGGAPIPPPLLSAAHKLSLPIVATYGMTEMSSIITHSHLIPNTENNFTFQLRESSLKSSTAMKLFSAFGIKARTNSGKVA